MQISLGFFIGVAVALALIVGIITHFVTVSNLRKNAESKIGNAEAKAREMIPTINARATATPIKKPRLICTGAPPYSIFIVHITQIQHLNFILFQQQCQAL